ncbi:hypothetical protein GSI_05529 [Ganoderma sinense ZZ0214-1]|uniref:Uncharacterized protein n=1 Tax=Ganoderma sinense ZZ0214-1 TaxID=1077348 RepID=A0A2G8SES9_9APHY|nr:hypothetical protein GSI_05529 [Ganoderma sinense ZZ0214-1]
MDLYPQSTDCCTFVAFVRDVLPTIFAKAKSPVPLCAGCRRTLPGSGLAEDECAFNGFRTLVWDATDLQASFVFATPDAKQVADLRFVFSKKHTWTDVALKKSLTKAYLLSVVDQELAAYNTGVPVFRQMDMTTRTVCGLLRPYLSFANWC